MKHLFYTMIASAFAAVSISVMAADMPNDMPMNPPNATQTPSTEIPATKTHKVKKHHVIKHHVAKHHVKEVSPPHTS